MDLDKLIHEKKHFAELEDSDVERFLQERKFRAEHLNIEFKSAFSERPGGKYEIKKICKYLVGFSNEDGGLVVYGVADHIKEPITRYPDFVTGLKRHPSPEDLSLWVKDRIHPLIASPAIRFFDVVGRKIAILKIPPGVNKPYCYWEPDTRSLIYFKRTAGGIVELTPDEVREFHRTQIIEQSQLMLRAIGSQESQPATSTIPEAGIISKHKSTILAKLEDPKDFGLVRIYCYPLERVYMAVTDLERFLQEHRSHFSESMSYFPRVDVFQNGVSVGYFPNAVRQDVKSTVRVSLYNDGFAAFDSLADIFLEGDRQLHAGWLCYELQRQLQLSKAALSSTTATRIHVMLDFEHIQTFRLVIPNRSWAQYVAYAGAHDPIRREVDLNEIHDYGDSGKRNVVMPIVRDMMAEVGRIFGLSQGAPGLWDESGYLTYVKGLENQR
jgi:hypothetical protein